MLDNLGKLYKLCRISRMAFAPVLLASFLSRLRYGRTLVFSPLGTSIRGKKHLKPNGRLVVGISSVGFSHSGDTTFLNIRNDVVFEGDYSIGRGCRFDVGKNAKVSFGKGGYINVDSKVIIMHELSVGDGCVISWDCQLLDEDFHTVTYDGKKNRKKGILIKDRVWIGCGAKIYSGTFIAEGCIVASDSVVRGHFGEPNCIIGGNPAQVIKKNVKWE